MPPAKVKTKTFLIGKELKIKDLLETAERASGRGTKTRIKTPDSLRQGASQAAGVAPTLRYGPAGDSAPRLRLKAAWERGERPAFGEGPLPSVAEYKVVSKEIGRSPTRNSP